MVVWQNMTGERPVIEERIGYQVHERTIESDAYNMQVIRDEVTRPDGTPGMQRWIKFTQPGVMLFAADREGFVYGISVRQYAAARISFEPPGGSLNKNQTGLQTVESKALKEAGITIIHAEELHPDRPLRELTSRVDHELRLFFAEVDQTGFTPTQVDVARVEKFPYDELYKRALNGDEDNPSVAIGIIRIKDRVDALRNRLQANSV